MGRVVSKSAQLNKSQKLMACAKERQRDTYNVIVALETFASDGTLTGDSYENAKGYIQRIYSPINKAFCMALEDEIMADKTVLDSCNTYLADIDLLNEDTINGEIEKMKTKINELQNSLGYFFLSIRTLNEAQIANLKTRISTLKRKLEVLNNFDNATQAIHENAGSQMAIVTAKIEEIFSPALFSNGCFHYSNIDMSWADELSKRWDASARSAELSTFANFKHNLREQFGFDQETVEIMCQVYVALRKQYPNASQLELDWRFTRLLGGLYYDEGEVKKLKWNDVAGTAIDQYEKTPIRIENYEYYVHVPEEKYFTDFLGISEEDYLMLRYKVQIQHLIVGNEAGYHMPNSMSEMKDNNIRNLSNLNSEYCAAMGKDYSNEDFLPIWNEQYTNFIGHGDFAHQQITTSAVLARRLGKDGIIANLYLGAGDEKVVEEAGWLGDATLKPVSFGTDDYIADLDAKNITSYMENNSISYSEAANCYYNDLDGGMSRAMVFLQETPLDEVKEKIYSELVTPELQSQLQIAASKRDVVELKRLGELMQSDSYAMERMKEVAPDTYNFIRNLESESPFMEDIQ